MNTDKLLRLCLTFIFLCLKGSIIAQQPSQISDFTITITFAQPITDTPSVIKAPLKYNKDFALILQMDDGNPAIHDLVMPYFKGQQGNPGLFYTEGIPQNIQPFKMDAVHFSFNGLGADIHNYVPGFLHWDNIINLWAGEFGIVNHGLTDPPSPDHELEVRRNASYTKRKTLSGTIPDGYDMNVYVLPNNVEAQLPIARQHNLAVYHDNINSLPNPLVVENLPEIQGIQISRWSITNNLFNQVQTIASQAGPGNHLIATFYNHGFGNVDITFDQFKTQMNQIAAAYGRNGSDRIWSASSSEVFEYLRLRELITVNTNINDNVLTLTFTGNNIPGNFRYYALTIVVEGASNIVDMQVVQPDGLSSYFFNQNKAQLNLKWNGRVIPDAGERASAAVLAAEQQTTHANALVAMDYVQMLPDGQLKETLRDRLCALPGNIPYELGFCRPPEFLGPDTAVCVGDTLRFTAPEALSYLWSNGHTGRTLTWVVEENTTIWARVTYPNNYVISDTVHITALPRPNVLIEPAQVSINPGDPTTLTASGAATYLWSTGQTTPSITVSPRKTTSYWVEGTAQNGCSSLAEALVEVVFTTIVDFLFEPVCLGDTSLLIAQIQTNDSIVSLQWDLNGDGVFGDAVNDTVRIRFATIGEKNVGLQVNTASQAVITKYNQVIVADKPQVRFSTSGQCVGLPVTFTDQSTVSIGTIAQRVWSTGDGNAFGNAEFNYQYLETGNYLVTLEVSSSYGCTDTLSRLLTIHPLPEFSLRLSDGTIVAPDSETPIKPGEQLIFSVEGVRDSLIWQGTVRTPTYAVTAAGNYYVDVYRGGCVVRRQFAVKQLGGTAPSDGMMNLFTPNGDGYNDVWVIHNYEALRPVRVAVYTRTGALVFQRNNYQNDWNGYYNGNPLPEGTYYYIIEGRDGVVIKGPLTIIR
ncbi:MAG: gliding motility-associated C-terminal domain-containing protein [Bacteroidetes bacterium]|nr:gliding motility-associated C-terminal domain-containing protein [Bacteroidota bacterium]